MLKTRAMVREIAKKISSTRRALRARNGFSDVAIPHPSPQIAGVNYRS
jgi:hypothetical protein